MPGRQRRECARQESVDAIGGGVDANEFAVRGELHAAGSLKPPGFADGPFIPGVRPRHARCSSSERTVKGGCHDNQESRTGCS